MTKRFRATMIDELDTSHDIALELSDDATSEDLSEALASLGAHGSHLYANGRQIPSGGALDASTVTHGSIISRRPHEQQAITGVGTFLVVVSGPEAGRWAVLSAGGVVRVGRVEGELRLPRDQLMSALHARFRYENGQVMAEDLDSSNGTLVEGDAIVEATVVEPGTYVHVGSSVLTVLHVEPRDLAVLGEPTGATYPFPRTFREAFEPLPPSVKLPRPVDKDPPGSSNSWWRPLLPIVSGIGFALYTGRWIFLMIIAIAPIIFFFDQLRQKRRNTKEHAGQVQTYEQDCAAILEHLAELRERERYRARVSSPSGGVATVFASVRHRRLWERRSVDDDFLSVTVGLAPRPSVIELVDPAREEHSRKEKATIWGMPVNVNLAMTGSLAVLGETSRGRAVVRSLLMGLAVSHSPGDLNVWIFGDEDASSAWGFSRWLPHAMAGDDVCRVAASATARGTLWSTLKQQLDQRSERRDQQNNTVLPVHVVVIDGAALIDPSDLSDLLMRGPSLGIIGIVVDQRLAPDGIMGTLTLGAAADNATFESRHQPLIVDVLTAEMSAEPAEISARRLAALRPAVTGVRSARSSSGRLVELLGFESLTAEALRASWAKKGPTTKVIVGTAADVEFSVDIVRNGPHGLVGGTTRSGKTEFLKTLIMALALNNHPDDLNFVIVDFKGGIDYVMAADLPHVLEVSSNQDLDRFERTIHMLMSEQRRRQRLFEIGNVANLDAYRVARERNPQLPPVPRMIVMVDEFGELMSSDVGREHLRQLESITRIGAGLGINLLLITQNFQGQLPDQVAANTGMRVCFRVQDPAHSKILLNSGIAATLDPALKGRAFAQLQGGEPIEFQSARVAGRRPDLETAEVRAAAQLRPFNSLAFAFERSEQGDVPGEETDMFALIEMIKAAVSLSGATDPVVPWPEDLPQDAFLADHMPAPPTKGVLPLGVVDLPDEQRQESFCLRFDDDHVLLLGGPRADLGHVLAMLACGASALHTPDELHIYGIDFTGRGLARLSRLPHCGAVASRNDAVALRLSRFLLDEVARRRSALAAAGVTSIDEYARRGGSRFPHVLVLVAGAERMLPSANTDGVSPLQGPITSLISDSTGLGFQVVLAGLPGIANYRPGAVVDRRLAFTAVDLAEYAALGAPRPMLAELDGPRKFLDLGRRCAGLVCSLGSGEHDESALLDALVYRLAELYPVGSVSNPPREFKEVNWPLELRSMLAEVGAPPAGHVQPLPVGLDSVSGEAVWFDAAEDGPTLSVSGQRKSGRSSTLIALAEVARRSGWSVIGTAFSRASPLAHKVSGISVCRPDEVDALIGRTQRPTLLLIDDVHRADGDLSELKSWSDVALTVVAGTPSVFSGLRGPLQQLGIKPARNGIVLAPSGFLDFEALNVRRDGVRPELLASPRPGVGVLGLDGELIELSVPLPSVVAG